ncbi:MAG: TRAP transporter large permease [Proteobacteria bacterium]|jgi:tripartite ATP-independent transporter DctM subunit|nr:TRAP transporter large permease [Pseudomonadota bacterium]
MTPHELALLFVAVALVLLLSGMPVAFALGVVSVTFMVGFMPAANISDLAEMLYHGMSDFTLLAIPLFLLMGDAIGKTRAATDLYESAYRWLYRLPGGLGIANVVGCSIFAAMCGSSTATAAAIGAMGIPEMRKRGYSGGLAGGLVAAGGTLGILIPPSITFILYGIVVEQSIGQLFIAGIVPGVLLATLFAIWVGYKAHRDNRSRRGDTGAIAREHFTLAERMESLPRLLPFAVIITVVMITLYGGFATPSEVAGVGAFATIVMVAIVYRCWRWPDVKPIILGTAGESCMLMMIIAMSFLFTYVMSYLHITQDMTQWLVTLHMSKWEYLFWMDLLVVLLGFFLPPVAIILMVTPVIMPGLLAHGFDPIWFGVNMTILMETGLIHPPVGLNLFVIQGIAPDIGLKELVLGVLPFIVIILLFVVVLSIFPQIATWLPHAFFKH